MTRVAAKKASPGSNAAAARSRNDFVDTPSGSVAYSNGPSNRMLSGSDYRYKQSMTMVLLLNDVSEKEQCRLCLLVCKPPVDSDTFYILHDAAKATV